MANHSGFCIKSVLENNFKDPSITIKDDFDFGAALESVYPLLDIIFNYLNDKELEIVIQVTNSWREIAERILKKRSQLCWINCYKKQKYNFLKHKGNLHFSNASIGIFLYDYRRLKLNNYICLHKETTQLARMTFAEYLSEEIVSPKVNYCLLSCPKVVSLLASGDACSNGSIFDGVLLPEIPGIRTTMFYCNPVKLKKDPSFIKDFINDSEELQCILIFALNDLHKSIDNLFKILLKDMQPENVAVGGGIIRGSKPFQNLQNAAKKVFSSNDTLCITFLKDKNTNPDFNAASFVINGNDYSNQEFHEEVMKFRKRVLLRTESIGFRICCGAKCEKGEESIIFNKHFPNTPLLGLEADGEIGWNCFNISDDEEQCQSKRKKSKKIHPKVLHEWSTIFVVITWGDLKGM